MCESTVSYSSIRGFRSQRWVWSEISILTQSSLQIFFLQDFFFLLENLKQWMQRFCGKKWMCLLGWIFWLIWEGTCFPLTRGCLGLQPNSAAGLKLSFHIYFLVPLLNENKCQSSGILISYFQVSTVHTVGLWQRKVVMTMYSSYRQCTVPSWKEPGNSLALSSASLISLPGRWLACFSKYALPRFILSRINHACMASTTALWQPQA